MRRDEEVFEYNLTADVDKHEDENRAKNVRRSVRDIREQFQLMLRFRSARHVKALSLSPSTRRHEEHGRPMIRAILAWTVRVHPRLQEARKWSECNLANDTDGPPDDPPDVCLLRLLGLLRQD